MNEEFRQILAAEQRGIVDPQLRERIAESNRKLCKREHFAVTYEIVTPESAERGDVEERGHILESGTLRDALRALHETRTCHVDGVECTTTGDDYVTVLNGAEFFTGAQESRTLHIALAVTPASATRVTRLANNERVLGRGRHVRAVWYVGEEETDSYEETRSYEGIERHCRAPDCFGVYEWARGGRLEFVRDYPLRIMAARELRTARP
jgi:hypothetical protein